MQSLRKVKILKLAVGKKKKRTFFFPAGRQPINQYRQRDL